MRLLGVLCVATVVFSAPSPQSRNTIDFLLDLNQDVLEAEKETPASVQPLPQAQVTQVATSTASTNVTTTTTVSPETPAPVREEQPKEQQIQDSLKPTDKMPMNTSVESESVESNMSDEQNVTSEVTHEEDISNETSEKDSNENTTKTDLDSREDSNSTENSTEDKHHGETERKVTQVTHSPQDDPTTVQQQEMVDLRLTNNAAVDNIQKVEVKPNQVVNHGTLVVDKAIFEGQQLDYSTTPKNVKKWKQNRGNEPSGWYSNIEFDGHKHGTHFEGGSPHWDQWGPHGHGNQHHNHDHTHNYDHHQGNEQYDRRHGHGHQHNHDYDHAYDHSNPHDHGYQWQ
ncbi:lateral signaling target protein 2 homolog [Toxorhynchites rutilus septentrionalis]|uniref:lateral signaling target protein 2 homolog n=1 Tax=Toxorhynchites rutilus septentrionalis TaxID=329112 RepID=UPI002478F0EF|nr:lateral signaling target protein 2 homolog [Toxorhynchites rutilus septentrionalis]